jgi:hypothetical protein
MSDIPRIVFPDYKREIAGRDDAEMKKAIHRRSRFFGTHELPGADCPIQKAAPRTPSGVSLPSPTRLCVESRPEAQGENALSHLQ